MNECNSVSKNHQKLWVYCWVGGCKETYHAWLNSLIWFQNPPKLLMYLIQTRPEKDALKPESEIKVGGRWSQSAYAAGQQMARVPRE